MSGSALYVGRVGHRRTSDPVHRFEYPVWYALLDLDALPELDATIRGFSHNRLNLTGFDDRDHMGPAARPVRDKLERWLRERSIDEVPARVSLLTHLRVVGHVFNPVSFFYCFERSGSLQRVVAEVNNTFGETFCYLLDSGGDSVRCDHDKAFHVSPFQPMNGRYRFHLTPPGERLTAHIALERDGGRAFDATLTLHRRALSTGNILRTLLRYPHTGLRTLALIHFQALRLWRKRAPFFSKPEPPEGSWRARHG